MNLQRVIAVRNTKTIYRDGELCIKLFHENHTKADVLNEAHNQARIEALAEEVGLHIPAVREVTVIDGRWAIVSDYIEGKTMERLMSEEPEKCEEYLALFVSLQAKIQSMRCPQLGRLRDKMNVKIESADLYATKRFDFHARVDEMSRRSDICHGDFNPSNIIIKPDGTPYVLDWSHVTQGSGAADAARSYLYFDMAGKKELAEKYLSLYCEATGEEADSVREWLPLVAASQSVTGNEAERAFLLGKAEE